MDLKKLFWYRSKDKKFQKLAKVKSNSFIDKYQIFGHAKAFQRFDVRQP
jgi:hypothetical protein